jgi:hypothetical protein
MYAWPKSFREGIAPQLSTAGLPSLYRALVMNDPARIQGQTTEPPLQGNANLPLEGACPVSFAIWQGDGLESVEEVEDEWVRICNEADQRPGEPVAVRHFFNWWDDGQRDEVRLALLAEVVLALTERGVTLPVAA